MASPPHAELAGIPRDQSWQLNERLLVIDQSRERPHCFTLKPVDHSCRGFKHFFDGINAYTMSSEAEASKAEAVAWQDLADAVLLDREGGPVKAVSLWQKQPCLILCMRRPGCSEFKPHEAIKMVTLPIVKGKSCTLLEKQCPYVMPHNLIEHCAAASFAAKPCMLPVLASCICSAPTCSPVSR